MALTLSVKVDSALPDKRDPKGLQRLQLAGAGPLAQPQRRRMQHLKFSCMLAHKRVCAQLVSAGWEVVTIANDYLKRGQRSTDFSAPPPLPVASSLSVSR
jgi:hypothetical protein